MGKKNKKSKAAPLTGLAAALVKAGALDEKQAQKQAREQRREDKAVGREAVAQREAEKRDQLEARRAAQAERDRQRQQEQQRVEAQERARRAVRDNLVPGVGGNRRWFFVARDGRVPFLELGGDAARMLAAGKAGIVESLGEVREGHVLVNERALTTLATIDKELIRFWRR